MKIKVWHYSVKAVLEEIRGCDYRRWRKCRKLQTCGLAEHAEWPPEECFKRCGPIRKEGYKL